jgi:integrase
MGSVYPKNGKWWIKFKLRSGEWKGQATAIPFRTASEKKDREKAKRILSQVEDRLKAEGDYDPDEGTSLTVTRFAARWVEQRRELGVQDWKNDRGRLRTHVENDALGKMPLADIRARHVVALVNKLRSNPAIADKTRYNVYSVLSALFRDAEIAGLIDRSPCILTKHQLGECADKDPEWRDTARFSQGELEALISDPRVSMDRRVLYALLGIGCLRVGEAAGLCWRHYDDKKQPLGRLLIRFSYARPFPKKKRVRDMPVHPTLAALLASWRVEWANLFGREPTPEDLIVSRMTVHGRGRFGGTYGGRMVMRTKKVAWVDAQADLHTLGFRPRRVHDLRRTGISLYQDHGATKDVLNWGTHGRPRAKTIDDYTTLEWKTLCAEVSKLQIGLPTLPGKSAAASHPLDGALVRPWSETGLTTYHRFENRVEAPGVECRRTIASIRMDHHSPTESRSQHPTEMHSRDRRP